MSILEGAVWIISQKNRKYLEADAEDGRVKGVGFNPRGIGILDSTQLRARIWLVERTTDDGCFRFRNYETGLALDTELGYRSGDEIRVVTTYGSTQGQLWEVKMLESITNSLKYQLKNTTGSIALDESDTIYRSYSRAILDSSSPSSLVDKEWLLEPVLLPTVYWLINPGVNDLVLRAPYRPNPSDRISGPVALVGQTNSDRNQLWNFEYTSPSEAVIRSASPLRFVLEVAPDSRTVFARKYHGESSQVWVVKDEEFGTQKVSLTNSRTGTLLATQRQQLAIGDNTSLNRVIVAPHGNTQWQIHAMPRPPLFWVTIQNSSGGFIAQADDESIIVYESAVSSSDFTAQWRFIMVDNGMQHIIINRATGFVLAESSSEALGSVVTGNRGSDNANDRWVVSNTTGGPWFKIVNAKSGHLLVQSGAQAQGQREGYYISQLHQWAIKSCYDALPSFALVNSHTGRCITNNPRPDIGTVSTTDDINDVHSQWVFYRPSKNRGNDLACVLLNKLSGNRLELSFNQENHIEAFNNYQPDSYSYSIWRLLPLPKRRFAVCTTFGPGFLYDLDHDSSPHPPSPKNIQALCWNLVSHREPGFDFVYLDLDTWEQVLEYFSTEPTESLSDAIQICLGTGKSSSEGLKQTAKAVPFAGQTSFPIDATIRVVLAHLILQWKELSVPHTREPRIVVSIARADAEKQWGVCFSERTLRYRSDEPHWARIDQQGVYDANGSNIAVVQGQWLDITMFRVIFPAEAVVDRAVIQRAMLHSLNRGLTVEIRPALYQPAAKYSPSVGPDIVRQSSYDPLLSYSGDSTEKQEQKLYWTLPSVDITSLKHDGS